MNASQMRLFEDPGIVASVLLAGKKGFLKVSDDGLIAIPRGVEPDGFNLVVAVDDDARIFVVQKDVGNEGGGYRDALSELKKFATGVRALFLPDSIDVLRDKQNVWTGWHKSQANNRVDCWHLGATGELGLFQIGVFTHDNGRSYFLHGEYRWHGQLYKAGDGLVGVPESPKWDSLEGGTSKRTQIFSHPDFVRLLESAVLPQFTGTDADVNPPLKKVGKGFAAVKWFIGFAGRTGQGIALLDDGKPVWIHGCDIEGFDPSSTEPLLWHGDIVSYEKCETWGSKPGAPPRIVGVRLVKRGH